jgi:uncharacterized protein DUF5996
MAASESWPALPLRAWSETYATLHMWTQIVGKVRMALTPPVNHWWHVPLYVTSRGLDTSPIPYGDGTFEVTFDFVDHALRITTNTGRTGGFELGPRAVADFYRDFLAALDGLGIATRIWPMPVEIPNPIRFTEDRQHAAYDREQVRRCWEILVHTDSVFKEFRGGFLGKCSPVHFFWGAFDLAVTRFSGRPVPAGGGPTDPVNREAYSHEVISHGFWPGGAWAGGGVFEAPVFYSYTVPEPAGFRQARVRPAQAHFSEQLGEFLLPYDDVRSASSPRAALLDFMASTYEAGASLAKWDRKSLER